MKYVKYLIIFSILFFINTKANCAAFSSGAEATLNTGIAIFPAGTMFKAAIQNTISTKTSQVKDPVSLVLLSDIVIGKSVCIPKNSIFIGEVVGLEPAKEGRDGYFRIAITQLFFADGWSTGISARIWDKASTDIIGGGLTERTEYRKIPHYIQHIGNVSKLTKTGPLEMGKDRELAAGKEIIIVLEEDLHVKYLERME